MGATLPVSVSTKRSRDRPQTVSAVSDRFIALYAKPNTKKWREAQALLQRYVLPRWGEVAIHDIRRADAHELLDRLVADGRVAMAREVRKHLTKLFNWSVDRGIVTASPLAGMERPEIAYRPPSAFCPWRSCERSRTVRSRWATHSGRCSGC
jgi:hypothetical protein